MASGEATEIATYSTWLTFSKPSISRALSLLVVLIILFNFAANESPTSSLKSSEVSQHIGRRRLVQRIGVADFHIQAQRLHFFDQHVEGFGHARFEAVVAFDNAFVNARAALHIVRFDGEQFLQRVSRSLCFHCPHFHFAKGL